MANTLFTQKSPCLAVGTFGRCQASEVDNSIHHLRFKSKIKHIHFSVQEHKQGLRFQKHDGKRRAMSDFLRLHFSCRNIAVYARVPPRDQPSVDPSNDRWRKVWIWILGIIYSLLLSFSRGKWGPLLLLREKVETTIEEAEHVVNSVEEVAETVDKVAEEAIEHLPKGKLRDAVELVEKVAEDIDKHAQNAENVLEKVKNMEKELESFIQSTGQHHENIIMRTQSKDQK